MSRLAGWLDGRMAEFQVEYLVSTKLRRRPSRDARCLFGPLLVASYDTQGIRGENSFIPSPYPQGTGVTRFDFAKLHQFGHGAPLISKIFPWKTTQIWAWWTPYLQSIAVYCSYVFLSAGVTGRMAHYCSSPFCRPAAHDARLSQSHAIPRDPTRSAHAIL